MNPHRKMEHLFWAQMLRKSHANPRTVTVSPRNEPRRPARATANCRGATTFLLSPRQSILPFIPKPENGYRRVPGTRRVSAVNAPPKERNSSESLSSSRLLPLTDRRLKISRRYATSTASSHARQPFRRCPCARHHPLARKRDGHCLAVASPSFRSLSTWATLPHYGF